MQGGGCEQVLGPLHVSDIETVGLEFAGSVPEWCELGFSICESYLIEAQNLFLNRIRAVFCRWPRRSWTMT